MQGSGHGCRAYLGIIGWAWFLSSEGRRSGAEHSGQAEEGRLGIVGAWAGGCVGVCVRQETERLLEAATGVVEAPLSRAVLCSCVWIVEQLVPFDLCWNTDESEGETAEIFFWHHVSGARCL